ncbi:hypothetical protein KXX44_003575 [Aspergillus fumigatus]|nr:hypothetical protein KXX29_005274 [Aspergillus fumigatus]KAH1602680.1 hypothetical protein KXX44_003575 [Aspergillus fumigatus]KAH1643513.1 hypothetical protein KXX39_003153 [Aspergillus fumigatus]KAH1764666.1 hypothetical protein KXX56_003455 [Aspergillus fumigatus]KAH1915855.1 hypothetical protein KXW69_005863 [Aspergillus fumigatus]
MSGLDPNWYPATITGFGGAFALVQQVPSAGFGAILCMRVRLVVLSRQDPIKWVLLVLPFYHALTAEILALFMVLGGGHGVPSSTTEVPADPCDNGPDLLYYSTFERHTLDIYSNNAGRIHLPRCKPYLKCHRPFTTKYMTSHTDVASAKTVDRYPDLNQGCWGLAIGVGNYHIMYSLGNRVTKHSPTRGYSMVLRAAMTVRLASWLGLVSTMQCIPGAVVGVALVNMDL